MGLLSRLRDHLIGSPERRQSSREHGGRIVAAGSVSWTAIEIAHEDVSDDEARDRLQELASRIERSFAAARRIVDALDREALRRQRPVTRALAAETLGQTDTLGPSEADPDREA